MSLRVRSLIVAAALVAVALPVSYAGGAAAAPCSGVDTIATSEASRQKVLSTVLCLANAERASRGLVKLKRSGLLAGVAQRQSSEMARYKYIGHVNRAGQNLRKRVARTGYRASHTAEAIAWGTGGQRTAASLFGRVMASPLHRKAVVGSRDRDAGVGLSLEAPVAGKANGATLVITVGRRK